MDKGCLFRTVGLAGLLLCLGSGATAQGRLEADVLKLYGGVYAVDCAQPQSPRVRVGADAILVEQGDRRLTAQSLQASHSFFGQSAPPGFFVALMGMIQGRHDIVFLVQGDARGQYLALDGNPTVLANLGGLAKSTFRSCDAAINQRVAGEMKAEQQAQAAARAPVASGTAKWPSELIRDARFKTAYGRTLGPLAGQAWLARMDGPGVELSQAQVAGERYQLAAFCKQHDCGDHNAVLLYDAPRARVYGLVHMAGRNQFIGSPPQPVAAELNRLWRREWRQGR
ncbi:Ivy family c-type lysozyme inhibitor [Hydrogenophaga sp.]|uniref:Ivy family c-type lysozyme inhibitor n=1 Tax=Hydrogenophaga sp. TaxID=1904254 RepID=UPI00260317AF|nr:Ivy family c-type lysozyme inhibitor [Hydrogenophaga sp.]MCW5654051.1 hypothetical protein [Hydrogenophaga sp.]